MDHFCPLYIHSVLCRDYHRYIYNSVIRAIFKTRNPAKGYKTGAIWSPAAEKWFRKQTFIRRIVDNAEEGGKNCCWRHDRPAITRRKVKSFNWNFSRVVNGLLLIPPHFVVSRIRTCTPFTRNDNVVNYLTVQSIDRGVQAGRSNWGVIVSCYNSPVTNPQIYRRTARPAVHFRYSLMFPPPRYFISYFISSVFSVLRFPLFRVMRDVWNYIRAPLDGIESAGFATPQTD